jgi:hypothetical protein
MEGGTFLEPEVQEAFGRFVEIRLHTDGLGGERAEDSQRNKRLQQKLFRTIALPHYAVVSPDGKTVYWQKGGVLSPEEVVAGLDKAPK